MISALALSWSYTALPSSVSWSVTGSGTGACASDTVDTRKNERNAGNPGLVKLDPRIAFHPFEGVMAARSTPTASAARAMPPSGTAECTASVKGACAGARFRRECPRDSDFGRRPEASRRRDGGPARDLRNGGGAGHGLDGDSRGSVPGRAPEVR